MDKYTRFDIEGKKIVAWVVRNGQKDNFKTPKTVCHV